MKAHELARQLLAGPNVPVWAHNPASGDEPIWIESVEGEARHGSCDDNEDVAGADEPIGEPVILLELCEDDGFIFD